jgi:hypothetical protein
MRRLVAGLQNSPDFVATIERLDLSSSYDFKLNTDQRAGLAQLLRGFTRLTDLQRRELMEKL